MKPGLILVLTLLLMGCSSSGDEVSAGQPSPVSDGAVAEDSAPFPSVPEIETVYESTYSANFNLQPEVAASGPAARLEVDDAFEIVEGWFLPADVLPFKGIVTEGGLRNPEDQNVFEAANRFDAENYATIDVLLVLDDSDGNRTTVLIPEARFDYVE